MLKKPGIVQKKAVYYLPNISLTIEEKTAKENSSRLYIFIKMFENEKILI
jgi:hypothetical protein